MAVLRREWGWWLGRLLRDAVGLQVVRTSADDQLGDEPGHHELRAEQQEPDRQEGDHDLDHGARTHWYGR